MYRNHLAKESQTRSRFLLAGRSVPLFLLRNLQLALSLPNGMVSRMHADISNASRGNSRQISRIVRQLDGVPNGSNGNNRHGI